MVLLLALLVWLAFSGATAAVGASKGDPPAGWFVFGLLVWPVAFPMVLTEAVAGRALSGRFWAAWTVVWVAVASVIVVGGWEASGR